MNRIEFLKTCGFGCLGLIAASSLLESCAGVKYLNGTLTDSFLEIPFDAFEVIKKEKKKFRKYVIVQHDELKYPICVYRQSASEYRALLMKCTHQGTELQVFGDRLQCPGHGSEFTKTGEVKKGPADTALRTLPVLVEKRILKIDLT